MSVPSISGIPFQAYQQFELLVTLLGPYRQQACDVLLQASMRGSLPSSVRLPVAAPNAWTGQVKQL